MKYEDEYGPCFDEMEGWANEERSLVRFLGQFNVHIDPKEVSEVKYEVLKVLALCHETGAIRPMTEDEKEKFSKEEESYRISEAMGTTVIHKKEFETRMKHWSDGTLSAYLDSKKEEA
jgi:hypothetical protein